MTSLRTDKMKAMVGDIATPPRPSQTAETAAGRVGAESIIDDGPALNETERLELERLRRRNVGRPRKGTRGNGRENRATFVVDRDLTRKIKYIALMETKLHKQVIAEALGGYVSEWERLHGEITFDK